MFEMDAGEVEEKYREHMEEARRETHKRVLREQVYMSINTYVRLRLGDMQDEIRGSATVSIGDHKVTVDFNARKFQCPYCPEKAYVMLDGILKQTGDKPVARCESCDSEMYYKINSETGAIEIIR